MKVLVIDRCEYCNGEAYVYAGEYKDEDEESPVYLPCHVCKGSGEMEKPLSLREFADLLDRATAMEPDWAELAREKAINQAQDSREAAGILTIFTRLCGKPDHYCSRNKPHYPS